MKRIGPAASVVCMFQACVLTLGLWSSVGCGSTAYMTPAPTISPAGGTYTTMQNIAIADSLSGFNATIYYTTDGSTPTTSSAVYGVPTPGPLTISQSGTVKAIAVTPAYGASAVVSATFTLTLPPAPAPTITPVAGTYIAGQSISIADSLPGATIYYTTDGSTPTLSSAVFAGPIILSTNITVQAIAAGFTVGTGYGVSPVTSAAFAVRANSPVISLPAGTYTSAQTVTITDVTPNVTIYYTTNGSTPTASSTPYSGSISVTQSETLEAIAIGSNNASSQVVSSAYVIQYPTATPVISPAGGTYSAAQTATITDATPNATIYYTTNGSTPIVTPSEVYSGPISVIQSEQVQAIAVATGNSQSAAASATFTLTIPTVPAPVLSLAGGTYATTQTVTITESLSGATVYYTIDGSTPTSSSPVYSGPITVASSTTISAIATDPGYNQSPVVTATYYISAGAMSFTGTVMSGTVPIYNAKVNLYAAGASGYGTGAVLLATTTTNTSGQFQFTKLANFGTGVESGANWSCPGSDPNPDPQIYITSVGGNTQGTGVTTTNNGAAAFVAAIGPCSQVKSTTTAQLNELTTVATVFALAQYISPGSGPGGAQIGTDTANFIADTGTSATVANALAYQGAIGLNNAVAGLVNLASISAGTAVTATTHVGTNTAVAGFVTVTATPETAKLITIADTIASCINGTSSTGNSCTDLFANASPPPVASVTSQPISTFAPAQDTIQATYYMAVNPIDAGTFTHCATDSNATTNLGCLFNLATISPPYTAGLTSAPTDWTVSVSYSAYTTPGTGVKTASGLAVAPNTCSNGAYFLYGPQKGAIDAYGNLWYVNASQHGANIAAISPIGVPLFCKLGISPYNPFSSAITIDTAGNIWASMTDTTTLSTLATIYEVPTPGAVPSSAVLTTTFTYAQLGLPATAGVYPQVDGIVADGFGNVFYSTFSSGDMALYEIPSGTSTSPYSTLVGSAVVSAESSTTNISGAVDSVGRVYFASNTAASGLTEATPPSAAIANYSITGGNIAFTANNSFTSGQTVILSGLTSADGLLLNSQQLTLTAATSTTFTATTTLPNSASVSDAGTAVVVGAGAMAYSVFTNNLGTGVNGAALDNNNYFYGGFTCCSNEELVKATISPAGTAIATQTGNYTYSALNIGGLTGTRSVTLDGAGNVWFGNEYASNDGGVAESQNTGIWSIGEAYTSGGGSGAKFTALSPAPTGLSGTDTCVAGTGCPIGGGFQKAALTGMVYGLDIDPSGNVWALNFTTPSDYGTGVSNANIVEILGAAVPIVAPLSNAAAKGKLATKP
jgi:hypothetical protein